MKKKSTMMQKLKDFGISVPFEAPAKACMGKELIPGSLQNVLGMAEFAKEFFE